MRVPRSVLLLGWAEDVTSVRRKISEEKFFVVSATENDDGDIQVDPTATIVYVVSFDTMSSSVMHGVFAHVRSRTMEQESYLLRVGNFALRADQVFPCVRGLPWIEAFPPAGDT